MDRTDNRTMTDDSSRERPATNPFGSLKIDFGGAGNGAGGLSGLAPLGGIQLIGDPTESQATPLAGGPSIAGDGGGRTHSKVLIIGSGPAGLTAAIYAARANLEPIVLAGSAPGGQLMLTSEVENYPGFPEGIDGPDMMTRFRAQAERFGTHIVDIDLDRIDLSERPFRAWARGTEYRGESVIIATGASALWLELESEQRLRGRGVSACATCDGFFFKEQDILVIGGGDTAMEEATYLTKFASKVTIVHRREEFRASKIMLERAQRNPKIAWITNSELLEVIGEGDGLGKKVVGATLRDTVTGETRRVHATGVFLAIGHQPNSKPFAGLVDMDETGYIKTHDGTRTSVEGVFAAGDVQDKIYRQAITAAGSGCMAAIDAERWLEAKHHAEAVHGRA
jgi:thioredoxin reductase (NADPH)